MVLKRLAPLALCFGLALVPVLASTAPVVSYWEQQPVRVWPPASRGINQALGDTMTRQLGAADSIDVTDSVAVFGARYVLLLVTGDAADSMAVPILQTRLPNGQWSGAGGANQIPPTRGTVTTPWTATTLVDGTTKFAWGYYNEVSAGGTPVPITNDYFRWRVKSTDARRYNSVSQATLAPTGNYQLRVLLLR